MKSLPFWFIFLASLFALAGMAWGIQMSISQDHTLAPAHAHNNLVGFVTMALYGIYYRLVPVAAAARLAVIHFWVAFAGAVTFGVGIALAIRGTTEIVAIISSLLTIVAMLIFAWTVWSNRAGLTNS
jgi:cbb3-type cytochrome oxidase subunit 1